MLFLVSNSADYKNIFTAVHFSNMDTNNSAFDIFDESNFDLHNADILFCLGIGTAYFTKRNLIAGFINSQFLLCLKVFAFF
jgi:hypothetical protein